MGGYVLAGHAVVVDHVPNAAKMIAQGPKRIPLKRPCRRRKHAWPGVHRVLFIGQDLVDDVPVQEPIQQPCRLPRTRTIAVSILHHFVLAVPNPNIHAIRIAILVTIPVAIQPLRRPAIESIIDVSRPLSNRPCRRRSFQHTRQPIPMIPSIIPSVCNRL